MKLKSVLFAAILATSFGSAFANDINTTVNLSGDPLVQLTGGFTVTHTDTHAFTDTFTFTPSTNWAYIDASLITIGFTSAQHINFTGATLNGLDLSFTQAPGGNLQFGTLSPQLLSGPLTLVVMGDSGGAASYSGTLNVNVLAVPEPETYGMLLGGLGLLGFVARRRKAS
ncbi:hypothetical protein AAKU55_005107 [Oxalobacteraceae bacterium GrIS 1.11]